MGWVKSILFDVYVLGFLSFVHTAAVYVESDWSCCIIIITSSQAYGPGTAITLRESFG